MPNTNYKEPYLPVDQDFEELILDLVATHRHGKIHFFNSENEVDDTSGYLVQLRKIGIERWLIVHDISVRMDKIITALGKPGPAYDYYNSFGNACLTCEDLGQF